MQSDPAFCQGVLSSPVDEVAQTPANLATPEYSQYPTGSVTSNATACVPGHGGVEEADPGTVEVGDCPTSVEPGATDVFHFCWYQFESPLVASAGNAKPHLA